MPSKRDRLIERAKQTVRQPKPSRVIEADFPKKTYRVIAVSLYMPEAEWVDQTTRSLQRAGNPKANRSLVVREAILRLQEELKEKSPEDILKSFIERHAERAKSL